MATLDVYQEEGLFERARMLEPVLEDAIHSLRDEPKVIDVRNIGIAAAVEFEPIEGQASIRAMNVFHHCFDAGVMVRYSGDIIAIGPSTTVSEQEIGIIVDTLRDAIRANQ